jgi:FkbM family methyltransferase
MQSRVLIRTVRKSIKASLNVAGALASFKTSDTATGSHPLRVLHGPNVGRVFFTRNLDQNYVLGYESRVSRAVIQHLHEGDVFYDIGANEGWFSVMVARKIGCSGRIYAFEPDRNNLPVLRKNLESNDIQKAEIIPLGIADISEKLTFASYPHYGLVSHVITPATPAASDAVLSEIAAISIDDFVAKDNLPPIS